MFSDKLIQFLITKIKNNYTVLKKTSVEVQTNFAKSTIVRAALNRLDFNKDFWFSETFINYIPWKEVIKIKPEILTTDEHGFSLRSLIATCSLLNANWFFLKSQDVSRESHSDLAMEIFCCAKTSIEFLVLPLNNGKEEKFLICR